MSKTLFDELIGEQELNLNCPKCNKKFDVQVNQIGTVVNCPYCSCEIELIESGDGFSDARKSTDEFEKTLRELEKTFKKF